MVLMDNIAMGRLVAPNLTSGKGGVGAVYSNEDFIRAIRDGVGRDGRSLIFMPSEGYQALTDVDLAAVIAYLRSVSPVDRTTSGRNPGPLARALHVAVGLPLLPAEKIDHSARGTSTVPGASVQYGEYLANLSGCRGCHGPALAGGAGPGPNITRGVIGSWSEQEFGRAVREGRRPDGRPISSQMPWKAYARMTDEEVRALHMYVLSLPAVAPKGK
jgi:mono/diheme cytochrome c family protein